jgi:hypothetical protein
MMYLRGALIAAALLLCGVIAWAGYTAPFWASFSHITANPWGVVTLVDLYAGFLVASCMVWLVEPRKGLAASLVLLTLVLGNIVTLLWLALRGIGLLMPRFQSRKA